MVEEGFLKGSSDNLPYVDVDMVDDFYATYMAQINTTENRHIKAKRSSRASYGDKAIGYVQLKREGSNCIVKAKITPEHKVHKKYYNVMTEINEEKKEILRCECQSCAASAAHCKHAIAFLFWLHRRSEEPAVTSQECYWKKSVLSDVGRNLESDLQNICKQPIPTLNKKGNSFLYALVSNCPDAHGGIFDVCRTNPFENVSMHGLSLQYMMGNNAPTPVEFIKYIKDTIDFDLLGKIELLTREQSKNPLWYEMRYGRITASKIHEASVSHTYDGSLVEGILGASQFSSDAMKRGLKLESEVLEIVGREEKISIDRCGLLLLKDQPLFGASPDGVSEDLVIEIKCPKTEDTLKRYVHNNIINKKHYAQLQMQMYFAKKGKGLFCVADPNFETNKIVNRYSVNFDINYCKELILKCEDFWVKAIYPCLIGEK